MTKQTSKTTYVMAAILLGGVLVTILLLFNTVRGREVSGPDSAQIVPDAVPFSLTGFSDSGRFLYLNKGERVAECEFSWTGDGVFNNRAEIRLGNNTLVYELSVTTGGEGLWNRIKYSPHYRPESILTRGNGYVTRQNDGRVRYLYTRNDMVMTDDWSPALYSLIALAYDDKTGGRQSIPVLQVPYRVSIPTVEKIKDRRTEE